VLVEAYAGTFEMERPDDYLLRLAATEEGREYKRLAISQLEIVDGDAVLDIGCGPGADLPALAAAVGGTGRVIGLDHDPVALAQAASGTRELPQVHLVRCDAHGLALADAAFDHFRSRAH
jgi:ubiquinone/menaquinone biosynthesis C-methylase UbiE